MHTSTATHPVRVQLAKRALLHLDRRARQVHIDAGSVWITQDHDPRDIVLARGERFTPDPDRQAIVYALDAAQLTLCMQASAPAPRRIWPRRLATRSLVLE